MNWGTILQGVGALANAWGTYTVGKESNKLVKEQLAYEKSKDDATNKRISQAQAELDGAMYNVYGTSKKKAKSEEDSLSSAFDMMG